MEAPPCGAHRGCSLTTKDLQCGHMASLPPAQETCIVVFP